MVNQFIISISVFNHFLSSICAFSNYFIGLFSESLLYTGYQLFLLRLSLIQSLFQNLLMFFFGFKTEYLLNQR